MVIFRNIWKHSRLRFYILNSVWNIKFWLSAEKLFKISNYVVEDENYEMADDLKIVTPKTNVSKKRFAGYMFKNNIYLDNPGLKIDDRETWKSWKKKGLIK